MTVSETSRIPQLFYDLFSRLIPGFYAVVVFAIATRITFERAIVATLGSAPPIRESPLIVLSFLVIGSYVFGLFLSLLSDGLERFLAKISPAHFAVLKQIAEDQKNRYPAYLKRAVSTALREDFSPALEVAPRVHYQALLILWYDQIRQRSPDLAQRLTRLRAEYRMYGGLAVASFLAYGTHIAMAVSTSAVAVNSLLLVALLAAGLAFTWGLARSTQLFQNSVINHRLPHVTEEDRGRAMLVLPPGQSGRL